MKVGTGLADMGAEITHQKGGVGFHGDRNQQFTCYPNGGLPTTKGVFVRYFDWRSCTFGRPEDYCNNHVFVRSERPGVNVFECRGHPDDGYVGDPGDAPALGKDDGSELEYEPTEIGDGAPELPEEKEESEETDALEPPWRERVSAEGPGDGGPPLDPPAGSVPVSPGDDPAPGRKPRKTKDRRASAALDYWEPIPARDAWVRHHVWKRRGLFVPGQTRDGPSLDELDDCRVTQYTFEGGVRDATRDSWRGDHPHRMLQEEWVGETWFFLKDKAPRENPGRRVVRHIGKQKPIAEAPEPEVLRKLLPGRGVKDRKSVV